MGVSGIAHWVKVPIVNPSDLNQSVEPISCQLPSDLHIYTMVHTYRSLTQYTSAIKIYSSRMCAHVCVCHSMHVVNFSAVLFVWYGLFHVSGMLFPLVLLFLPNSDHGAYTARVCTCWISPRPSHMIFKCTFNCCTKCSKSKYLRHW